LGLQQENAPYAGQTAQEINNNNGWIKTRRDELPQARHSRRKRRTAASERAGIQAKTKVEAPVVGYKNGEQVSKKESK